MPMLIAVAGFVGVVVIMWDVFEAMVLPRRVTRRLRPTRVFYGITWGIVSAVARRMRSHARRDASLAFYGPLSLLLLINLWALCLIVSFAMAYWGLGLPLNAKATGFGDYLYLSGTTFFTLGFGDLVPTGRTGRILSVVEAGTGFAFLALVIGYLPVLYQAFSRREVTITLLDERAGSPPSAEELLRRHAADPDELRQLLARWEQWSAEVLESHLSYPVLIFYRSQHDNQSWLAALTTILDACALAMVGLSGPIARQAQLTFAIARHAVVDLSQALRTPPLAPAKNRLPARTLAELRATVAASGMVLDDTPAADGRLDELRRMYEPYVNALCTYLLLELPPWRVPARGHENWRTSAWERRAAGADAQPHLDVHDHDD